MPAAQRAATDIKKNAKKQNPIKNFPK